MSITIPEDATIGRIDSPVGDMYSVPYIPLYYDHEDADASALKLVQTYAPEQWKDSNGLAANFTSDEFCTGLKGLKERSATGENGLPMALLCKSLPILHNVTGLLRSDFHVFCN